MNVDGFCNVTTEKLVCNVFERSCTLARFLKVRKSSQPHCLNKHPPTSYNKTNQMH